MKRFKFYFCFLISLSLCLQAQQWTCTASNGSPLRPQYSVRKTAYIPVNWVTGPSACLYWLTGTIPIPHIYKGDDDYVAPYVKIGRINQAIYAQTNGVSSSYQVFPGQTRQYGFGSPANGSTLSSTDEDNVPEDCFHWTKSANADTSTASKEISWPYSNQVQIRYYGTVRNPLELPGADISWDERVTIIDQDFAYPQASVNYNHSCYPAHLIQINGFSVYNYHPPDNSLPYIFMCLALRLNKVVGSTSNTRVPCL